MRIWVLQEVVYARDIATICQHGDKRINYITWDEARDVGLGYLDRCKDDNRNTPVEEDVEHSIAMMISMDEEAKPKVASSI